MLEPLTKGARAAHDHSLSREALPDQAPSLDTGVRRQAGVWPLTRGTYRRARSLPSMTMMRKDKVFVAQRALTRADSHTYEAVAYNSEMIRQTKRVIVSRALNRKRVEHW